LLLLSAFIALQTTATAAVIRAPQMHLAKIAPVSWKSLTLQIQPVKQRSTWY